MYPMLRENVALQKHRDPQTGQMTYIAENVDGKRFIISKRLYRALSNADGTHPLQLPHQGRGLIPKLRKDKLIYTSRFVHFRGPLFGFILTPIPKKADKLRRVCRPIAKALPFVSILMLIVGICMRLDFRTSHTYDAGGYYETWLLLLLIVLIVLLHELGHVITGISAGYKIRSLGVLLLIFVPIGAYISRNDEEDEEKIPKTDRLQFDLGGVEMNMLAAGILLILSVMPFHDLSFLLVMAANVSIMMVFLNLLPGFGLDGESAFSILFGVESIAQTAMEWILIKSRRRLLRSSGFAGWCLLIGFSVIFLIQIIVLLLLIAEVIGALYFIFTGFR